MALRPAAAAAAAAAAPSDFTLHIVNDQHLLDADGQQHNAGRGVIFQGTVPGPVPCSPHDPRPWPQGCVRTTRILPCNGPTMSLAALKAGFPDVKYSVDTSTGTVNFTDLPTDELDRSFARFASFSFCVAPEHSFVAVPDGCDGTYVKMRTTQFLERHGDRLRGASRGVEDNVQNRRRLTYVTVMHESVASCINDGAYMARTSEEYELMDGYTNNVELLPVIGESYAHDLDDARSMTDIQGESGSAEVPCALIRRTLTVVGFGIFPTRPINAWEEDPEPLLLRYGFGVGRPETDRASARRGAKGSKGSKRERARK